ncbi:MAG: ATPase, T2SS/T4P/T4SS family [Patescibacteria group bacterium]
MLLAETQEQVQKRLVDQGLISEARLRNETEEAEEAGEPLFAHLVNKEIITDEHLTRAIAESTEVPYVNLSEARVNPQTLSLLGQEVAERYMAVPLGEMEGRLVVAMLDAGNVQAVDFLSTKIGRPLKVYLASETGIRNVLKQYEIELDKDVADVLEGKENATTEAGGDANIKTIVQDSPISKALSAILEYAAKNRASDIHIEPLEKELKIRVRVDGVLREIMTLPKATEAPLVSRVKILSNLKIDEHRIPQDGQFTIRVLDKNIDLRISISPVVWGEQIVIRLLDKSGTSLKLEDMGYMGRALKTIRHGIASSNGMVLTSGPTGSGKSTSLYALIQEIKGEDVNIVTLEDPVEYKMDGINQIQVNAEVGLTFASGLRSILRQDPDVVMVGEIRDKETATLAVQAALTGHLVFSTLHTNSAAGILPRLLDMGIEPFLIASTVRTVIGQRLVRRVSEEKEEHQSTPAELAAIQEALGALLPEDAAVMQAVAEDLGYTSLPLRGQNAYTLYSGIDDDDHPGGYKGRLGLYEVFNVSEEIQKLIIDHATSSEIQKLAMEQGMVTMRQDGYLKALAGMTTIDEVNRVASASSA